LIVIRVKAAHGLSVFACRSLPPLFISLLPGNHKSIQRLRSMRAALSQEIFDVVEDLGPTVFDDFESQRALGSASADTQKNKPASGPDVLAHPLAWLDEKRTSNIVIIFLSCANVLMVSVFFASVWLEPVR
jgi:hypothetical protein